MTQRTAHRILLSAHEIKHLYRSKVDIENLPESMEVLDDGIHVASYLSDKDFEQQNGKLFPVCPVTGAFGFWDADYNEIGDLF